MNTTSIRLTPYARRLLLDCVLARMDGYRIQGRHMDDDYMTALGTLAHDLVDVGGTVVELKL